MQILSLAARRLASVPQVFARAYTAWGQSKSGTPSVSIDTAWEQAGSRKAKGVESRRNIHPAARRSAPLFTIVCQLIDGEHELVTVLAMQTKCLIGHHLQSLSPSSLTARSAARMPRVSSFRCLSTEGSWQRKVKCERGAGIVGFSFAKPNFPAARYLEQPRQAVRQPAAGQYRQWLVDQDQDCGTADRCSSSVAGLRPWSLCRCNMLAHPPRHHVPRMTAEIWLAAYVCPRSQRANSRAARASGQVVSQRQTRNRSRQVQTASAQKLLYSRHTAKLG